MLEGHTPLLHHMGLVVLDAAAHDLFLDEAVQNQPGQHHGDGYRYRFRKKLVSQKVSVSVSKKFGIEKSIGIGFVKFWY